ncbi:MAG: hypothetical protein LBV34_04170 [Nocardiopsaceae bacterium]|nr:hypothetical protein [Nocardiopsaceae bacterium]
MTEASHLRSRSSSEGGSRTGDAGKFGLVGLALAGVTGSDPADGEPAGRGAAGLAGREDVE